MSNVINMAAHRSIRILRDKIAKVDEQISQIRIIWGELTEEERLDRHTVTRIHRELTKAYVIKGKALYAISKIKERAEHAI